MRVTTNVSVRFNRTHDITLAVLHESAKSTTRVARVWQLDHKSDQDRTCLISKFSRPERRGAEKLNWLRWAWRRASPLSFQNHHIDEIPPTVCIGSRFTILRFAQPRGARSTAWWWWLFVEVVKTPRALMSPHAVCGYIYIWEWGGGNFMKNCTLPTVSTVFVHGSAMPFELYRPWVRIELTWGSLPKFEGDHAQSLHQIQSMNHSL